MAPEVAEVDDFDAFWQAEKAEQPHARIRGVEVPIPMDIPLALAAQMQGATEADEEQNKKILAELYGPEIIESWIREGMGTREFFVVLTWSFVRGSGGKITFAEAVTRADEVLATMAAAEDGGDQGKAPAKGKAKPKAKAGPNRATRRSAAAGASSSPTSAASTGSRRKTSAA